MLKKDLYKLLNLFYANQIDDAGVRNYYELFWAALPGKKNIKESPESFIKGLSLFDPELRLDLF